MARVVALLRGVNIGKRQLPMASLRTGLEAAGCADVATYVQSGNVVLTPPDGTGDLAAWLSSAVAGIAGFEVPVVVRTSEQLRQIVASNPYPQAGGTQLHVAFCSEEPAPITVDLETVVPEHATVIGCDVYLHLPDGMARATLPTLIERASKGSGIVVTTRNWNTVLKLHDMARAITR